MSKPRVASMFAGIGGICLGFKQAGCEIVWANEFDSAACKTYRHNFGGNYLIEADIRKVDVRTILYFDILVAGFPCQPFSIAGQQKGFSDRRGNLFFEIARVIDKKRPPIVFLENVPNLIEHDNGKTFLVIYTTLAQFGYAVRYKIMSAMEYGNIPQTRSRIFIIAFLDVEQCDRFCFPEPVELKVTIDDVINRHERKHEVYYYNENSSLYHQLVKRVTDRNCIFQPKDRGIVKLSNGICPTLTASMGTYPDRVPVVLDDFGIRKLTIRECLDFQGFPQDYKFPNTITLENAYKQIGNSVCVPVVERIAKEVME